MSKVFLFSLAAVLFQPAYAAEETADSVMCPGEVVVTGSGAPVADNLLPYTVSVVGRDRLESTGQTQVLSAISGLVPSLFVTQRGIVGFGVSNGGSGRIKF
ncbi:MAG: TonB-dependent receptor, partial [Paramuribaculum sp.]|nr:TonB-dependent receptor [Paramuribaculum sp.]